VKVYPGSSPTGTPAQTLTSAVTAGAWSAVPSPALPEGTYTAQATQSDAAGNLGVSAPHTFTVDTSAPSVSVTAPAPGATTKDTTPTFRGTAGTAGGDSASVTVN